MPMGLREDADQIIKDSISNVLPDEAVRRALADREFGSGKLYMVAAGKAAWQMASAASGVLGAVGQNPLSLLSVSLSRRIARFLPVPYDTIRDTGGDPLS